MNNTNNDVPVETREQVAARIYTKIQYLLEEGNSQLLDRKQALQIAAWGLEISGHSDLKHAVLAELVELPENYG